MILIYHDKPTFALFVAGPDSPRYGLCLYCRCWIEKLHINGVWSYEHPIDGVVWPECRKKREGVGLCVAGINADFV